MGFFKKIISAPVELVKDVYIEEKLDVNVADAAAILSF